MTNTERDTWQILLIDDDEDDYLITRDMLSKAQGRRIQIDWAASYQEGRQRLQHRSYDAVLVDYDLGPRTGIQLIREFIAQGCATPLILSTGQGSYDIDFEAMQAGATLYIAKSESSPLLLERSIRYSIERKQNELTLKNYAEQLAQSNRALEDFAFIASHDLQEPLRKLQSLAGLLRSHCIERADDKGVAFIGRMQEAVQRMSSMLSNLLDYSRVNTKGLPFEPIDMNEMAADVTSDLEVVIKENQASLQVEGLPTIQADPLQMYQLIQNLVANAVKYHRPGVPPEVKISGQIVDDDWFELCVSDNGIGFDERYADEIFRPFFRLDTSAEFGGTGIGLAVCAKIVERHNGTIQVHSTAGVGSQFIVRLPLRQANAPAARQ